MQRIAQVTLNCPNVEIWTQVPKNPPSNKCLHNSWHKGIQHAYPSKESCYVPFKWWGEALGTSLSACWGKVRGCPSLAPMCTLMQLNKNLNPLQQWWQDPGAHLPRFSHHQKKYIFPLYHHSKQVSPWEQSASAVLKGIGRQMTLLNWIMVKYNDKRDTDETSTGWSSTMTTQKSFLQIADSSADQATTSMITFHYEHQVEHP